MIDLKWRDVAMTVQRRGRRREKGINKTWVRNQVEYPRAGRLRILIYARYSTDEQNPRSIEAQIEYVKKFLADLGIDDYELVVLSDEGISGEHKHRPGIDAVREGIEKKSWDIIACEESSRLYRNPAPCVDLVGQAVDANMRVICINDRVDSAEKDDWEDRLYECQQHHSRSNHYTIQRIKRAHEDLWNLGAAVGPLRTGYKRRHTVPATDRKPAQGPHFDEINPETAPIVREAFERVAAGEPLWSVAEWLTSIGLVNEHTGKTVWSDATVVSLIRQTVYRGKEKFRDTVTIKKHVTGKRRQEKNDPDEVWWRDMDHLRVISDTLWFAANEQVDSRGQGGYKNSREDHPLRGIPRDSRSPLSKIFYCSICGRKMIQNGRNEGGYRCSGVNKGTCWNKTTALRDLIHETLREATVYQLSRLDDELLQIIEAIRPLLEDSDAREEQITRLRSEEQQLDDACEQLADAVEAGAESNAPQSRLQERLTNRERELRRVRGELNDLQELNQQAEIPTREELSVRRDELVSQLREMGREAAVPLGKLYERIEAIPHRQFSGNKVVLRAKLELRLSALLPDRTALMLSNNLDVNVDSLIRRIPIQLDLFKPSTGPEFGLAALKIKEETGLGLTAVGKRLGINKRRADLAIRYGRKLRDAGLTDPFIELTEAPESAARWRTHPKHLCKDGNNSSE
jgi:hypothetical protein